MADSFDSSAEKDQHSKKFSEYFAEKDQHSVEKVLRVFRREGPTFRREGLTMLTFCSVSGFPIAGERGFFSPLTDMIGFAQTDKMPDLLEEQYAELRWFSDEGVRVKYKVKCSVKMTDPEAVPPSVEFVTHEGREVPLIHPVVVHYPTEQRVVLRLPESFRDRAYTALSWWMMCLQHSPRDVVPDYARRPELEFFHLTESRGVATPAKAMRAMPASDSDTVRDAQSPRRTGDVDPFLKPETIDLAPPVGATVFSDPPVENDANVPTYTNSSPSEVSARQTQKTQLSSVVSDPASTREAPAPVMGVSVDSILVQRGQARASELEPSYSDGEIATKVRRRPEASGTDAEVNVPLPGTPDWTSTNELTDTPTIARRPEPSSLSEIRGSSSGVITAVRQLKGEGIGLSPEYESPSSPPVDVSAWRASGNPWMLDASVERQRCSLAFKFPRHASRILDQGGEVSFALQLHRVPTYPLLVMLFTFQDRNGEVQDYLFCPLDVEDTNTLIFLDILMQDFSFQVFLCDDNYEAYRDLQIQLSLEPNVEYLIEQARQWKQTIEPGLRNITQAISLFQRPEFDRLGQMSHNFSHDSFSDIHSPARARLASGIIAYWSEPDQYDYLLTIKSFPIEYFKTIQKRVLKACLEFGIFMPTHLLHLAVDANLGQSVPDLLRQMLASFAEVNLNLRQSNDLDLWDNLENWQQLFDMCDQHGVEIDDDIEELAQRAQRDFEAGNDNSSHEVDDEEIEIVEDFQDMDPRDLLDMLQDLDYRYEAALALCDIGDPAYVDHAAAAFTEIDNREDAILFADAFTQFGAEAEPLLVSWLHLPRKLHREAAMLALGTMRTASTIDAIIKRLRSGEEWETAAEALGRMGDVAIPALGQELQNKNWLIRLRAVKALHNINTPQAIALIESLSQDPNEVVKAEVISVLGN